MLKKENEIIKNPEFLNLFPQPPHNTVEAFSAWSIIDIQGGT